MPDPGLVSSKVRAYMEALSPQARAMLVKAARQSVARGDTSVPGEMLLKAAEGLEIDEAVISLPLSAMMANAALAPLTAAAQDEGGKPDFTAELHWRDRVDAAFWAPLDPFIVEIANPVKQIGRIARASVNRLMVWLPRDVAGAEFAVAYSDDPRDPKADIRPIVARLRRMVLNRLLETIRQAEDDPKTWQRFVAHLGGESIVADLRDVVQIFQRDQALDAFLARLPRVITAADVEDETRVPAIVRDFADAEGMDYAFIAAAILSRASSPHLLAILATRLASTMDVRILAAGRYSRLIDCLIAELERRVATARHFDAERRTRDRLIPILREHHEIHRQATFVVEIDKVSFWHRRMGAVRKDMSDLVGRYVEAAPGLIRRSLRVESLASGSFGGSFDTDTFEDAEFAVRLVLEARLAAESLALNELLTRTRRDVERTLELVTEKLFTDLKSNSVFDRKTLLDAVDGAIRLCRHVFGEDYAAVLRKNRDLVAPKTLPRAVG